MGRPFESELKKISDTYLWAIQLSTEDIKDELLYGNKKPLFIVGSGGSLSACNYLAMLYQQQGMMAKAITPLELFYSREALRESNVLFLSASGRNTDILFGYKTAVGFEPNKIFSLCMKTKSPLAKLASEISISRHFEYNLPTGKDGFLATNSLVAFFTILFKTFTTEKKFPLSLDIDIDKFQTHINDFLEIANSDYTFTILYGGWGQPVAIDLESKLAEAALGNVLVSDYRNFGHGRHHWFDKRKKNSAIIALITPNEKELAYKTISLLPNDIPVLEICSEHFNSFSSIELLVKSFYFINTLGIIQKIDPGRPGVPDYGSKLYHLNYKKIFALPNSNISNKKKIAIIRKANASSFEALLDFEKSYWSDAYDEFVKSLSKVEFGSIVLDYDGTVCSSLNRYAGITKEIAEYFNNFLSKGIIIGIATGRGKSVREDLQRIIDKKYWKQVVIGYYNCSDIGLLAEDKIPNKDLSINVTLQKVYKFLSEEKFIVELKPELKPHQIVIEIIDKKNWGKIRSSIIQYILSLNESNVQILESSHSMDIIDQTVTNKLNIIDKCVKLCSEQNFSENCLCIGDKGKWPGNDYQLLSSKFSLSVDEVSSSRDSCWNLSEPGIKNVEATLHYLSCLELNEKGLKINIV